MITDTVLKQEGMRVLTDHLGLVEAERFIMLLIREPFDYTKWQQNLYDGFSVEQINEKAMSYWAETH